MKHKAVVSYVEPGSIAEDAGIQEGDIITRVNGRGFADILEFKFLTGEDYYTIEVAKTNGETEEIEIYNDLYEQFGADFTHPLLDEPKTCRNKCVFCFMDQLPPNVRSTMVFKDDDVRLSFLQGNYVTLTNLNDEEINRLIRMRVSPINVSVHATDPQLRCKMLNNRHAGRVMEIMRRFAGAGIYMNAQIVLCPGLNDGAQLDRTLQELSGLHPYIRSISAVPVGLSKYRDGLYPLAPFDSASSAQVIAQVQAYQERFLEQFGSRLVYLADEFYIQAGQAFPAYEEYEDFPQIENGVGLAAALMCEVEQTEVDPDCKPGKKTVATGMISEHLMRSLVEQVRAKNPNVNAEVVPIVNRFFGERITVTGLLTGSDLMKQLAGRDTGTLLICESMLKEGTELFLDDTTVSDVERTLGVPVRVVRNDGADFVASLLEP